MDNDALDKLAQTEIESVPIDFREGTNQITTTSTANSAGSNNNSSEFGSMSGKQAGKRASKMIDDNNQHANYIAYNCVIDDNY